MATKLNICYKGIVQEFECAKIVIIDDVTVISFTSIDDNMKLLLNFMAAIRIPVEPNDIKRNSINISTEYVRTTLHGNGTYISPVKDDNVYDAYSNLQRYRTDIQNRIAELKHDIKHANTIIKGLEEDIKYLADSNNNSLLIAKRHAKSALMAEFATIESELKEQTLLLEEVSKRLPIVDEVIIKRPLSDYATNEDILKYNDILVNLQECKRFWKWQKECYETLQELLSRPLLYEDYIKYREVLQKYVDKLQKLLK